jgi:altronate dehydratase
LGSHPSGDKGRLNSPLARVNGDIAAGTILERKESTEEVGRKIFEQTLDVPSGRKLTRTEQARYHHECKIWAGVLTR